MPDDLEQRVRALLLRRGLKDVEAELDKLLPTKPAQRTAVLKSLEILLQHEVDRRAERAIIRRIGAAQLPDMPTLQTFDFDFQTGVDRDLILDLGTLAWVDRTEDLVLIGQSGVGKSHIAKALCLIGCQQQRTVRYTSCANMLAKLYAALADNSMSRALKPYIKPQILLIDDLGYDPIEQEQAREAQLLYKVLEARHEKTSTIITSNMPAEKWADYLGNHYLTIALLDRLLYHGTVITIEGPSYRLAQHRKRQELRETPDDEDSP